MICPGGLTVPPSLFGVFVFVASAGVGVIVPAGVKRKSGTRLVERLEPSADVAAAAVASLTPKQRAAWDVLSQAERPMEPKELALAAGCSLVPIRALRQRGWRTMRR